MRRTVRKLFWAWEFAKEEVWLNQMAAKGLALVAVGFCKYIFEDCTPGAYGFRLELLEHSPGHAESQQYIAFVEETGAEYLGAVTRWVYFRKPAALVAFDLYSDNASRIRHLNRLLTLIAILTVMNLSIGLSNISIHMGADSGVNLATGMMNLALGLFTGYGYLRVYGIRKKLKKDQCVFE